MAVVFQQEYGYELNDRQECRECPQKSRERAESVRDEQSANAVLQENRTASSLKVAKQRSG